MAKALKTAAIVVGAAALLATGIGAAGAAGLLGTTIAAGGSIAGVATAATFTTIGTLAGVASTIGMAAAQAGAPKGTVGGNATKFKVDKDSGIPIVFGRTYVGGNVVHRQYYDDPGSRMKNQRESWVTALSLGPVKGIGPLLVDKKPVYFSASGAALGSFAGNMWLDTQLGACPEARALRGPTGDFPGWNATSKLSGIAADLWTLDFDSKGEKFPAGVPDRGRVLEGVFVYDPRLDSTYPGGVGGCRIDDPATHVYSENMWLQALTFAYGFYQNGHLVAGGGLPINGIDANAFVQAANTADANGWKAGGLLYTTADDDWDILKMLAQAGGGEVFPVGGVLTCTHAAPRVSIGTITSADVIGNVVAPSTARMRVRRNTIIPRVRLEEQGWEVVPIAAVSVPEYVAIDRAPRPREVEYPLIQSARQGAQIAMYEMLDARELEPIVLPCKLPTIGYRPGDCVTLDIPEANLVDREVVLRDRELDMATFGVTFSARTETAAKHPFALGASTTPPPTPDLSVPGLDLEPPVGWTAVATMIPSPSVPMPAIIVSGLVDNGGAEAVHFDYRPAGTGEWLSAGVAGVDINRIEITAVVAEAVYDVSVRYKVRGVLSARLVLGPITIPSQDVVVDFENVTGPTKPADNATNGADRDSPFGPDGTVGNAIDRIAGLAGAVEILADTPDADKLLDGAKALVDRVRVQQVTQLADQLLAETRKQLLDERTHVDGIPTGTQIKRIDREWREGDSLLAETISSVSTAIDTVDGRLTSEVVRLDQARIDGDTAQATALSNVRAEMEGDIAGVDGRVTGEVTRLEQAIVDGDGAQATALSNVRAEMEGDIAGVDGRVTGEVTRLEQAIVDGDGAQATALSNVRAEMEGDIAGVDGRVTGEVTRLEQAIVDGDGAQATALSNVRAEMEGDIAGVDGRVTGEVTRLEQAIVDGDGAQATAIEQVRATVGDVQATVTQQAAAIVDIEGKVMAYLLFEVEAGTGRAVVRLAADGRDGSTIDFAANALRFANPVDGRNITAMQVAGGNVEVVNDLLMGAGGHIISRSGAYMQVNGAPFGSQSQFVEWYGPVKASLAECTAADAISYKTVNGSAYFGGSLTAGVLRNAVRTSTLIGTANVTTGTFGSNGGPRVVVVSLNFAGDLQITGACPVAQQPSAKVQLWRGIDAETGVLLSEQVIYGTHECEPGFGAGNPGSIVDIVSGSFTYTDNSGGTTAAYFARIVDRTTYVVPTTQELALVSVEE